MTLILVLFLCLCEKEKNNNNNHLFCWKGKMAKLLSLEQSVSNQVPIQNWEKREASGENRQEERFLGRKETV